MLKITQKLLQTHYKVLTLNTSTISPKNVAESQQQYNFRSVLKFLGASFGPMVKMLKTTEHEVDKRQIRVIKQKCTSFFPTTVLQLTSNETKVTLLKSLCTQNQPIIRAAPRVRVKKHKIPMEVLALAKKDVEQGELQRGSEMAYLATDVALKNVTPKRIPLNSHFLKRQLVNALINVHDEVEKKKTIINGFNAAEQLHQNFFKGEDDEEAINLQIQSCEQFINCLKGVGFTEELEREYRKQIRMSRKKPLPLRKYIKQHWEFYIRG